MVYFHAVDYVHGRTALVRRAWRGKVHLPPAMFSGKKPRKGAAASKLHNYSCFKRMLAIKPVVFSRHKEMLRLYQRYCHEASRRPYFDDDDDDEGSRTEDDVSVVAADDTNEADCDEGF